MSHEAQGGRRSARSPAPGALVAPTDSEGYMRLWAVGKADALRAERKQEQEDIPKRNSLLPADIDESLLPGLDLRDSAEDELDDTESSERWAPISRCLGVVVTIDILALWAETDNPDIAFWWLLGHGFLWIYVLELVVNAHRFGGLQRFHEQFPFWSIYESGIIVLGMAELWLLPVLEFTGWRLRHWALLLRLLRTLRMFRVFRLFDELHDFGTALNAMAATFSLVFLVMLVTLSSFAVIFVHLMGHGEAFPEATLLDHKLDQLRTSFLDVGSALFTLFQFTTQDHWTESARHMISIGAYWRLFFVAFIPFASWTMLAIMSAEASNCMIEATVSRKEEHAKLLETKTRRYISFLRDAFLDADTDGNGMLDMDEFKDMMQNEEVLAQMKELGCQMSYDELLELFNLLDVDDSGELTIDEFVDGLAYLQEGLSTKHIVNVDYSLKRVEKRVEGGLQEVGEAMAEVTDQHVQILKQLTKHQHARDIHRPLLIHFQQWATDRELDGERIVLPPVPDNVGQFSRFASCPI